ncbi:hypothetical protein AB1E18_008216 [Capra hircus]
MFCPRPARMVPSITHGLILAPLASSREREPAHLPGRELQPPTVAASLELCPAVNRPWASWLWASSCAGRGPGREAVRKEWTALEWMAWIPGSSLH